MYISYQELVGMTICAALSAFMLAMLFWSNYSLLRENRFLRSRLKSVRKQCQQEHVCVPF
jgi:hypothetical protein